MRAGFRSAAPVAKAGKKNASTSPSLDRITSRSSPAMSGGLFGAPSIVPGNRIICSSFCIDESALPLRSREGSDGFSARAVGDERRESPDARLFFFGVHHPEDCCPPVPWRLRLEKLPGL